MNFCPECGARAVLQIPPGDTLPRHCCTACGAIHYLNPKLVIGTLPVWEGRVLLCRRAIEPRLGYWTLPAGFMENGETTAQAAIRETLEEANARVDLEAMQTLVSLPHASQVHIFYRARLIDGSFSPGAETLETRLFKESEIPWGDIAFRTTAIALREYFADRVTGRFEFRSSELGPPVQETRQ